MASYFTSANTAQFRGTNEYPEVEGTLKGY